jgi:L-threonylcarbamoyladenylate synthase
MDLDISSSAEYYQINPADPDMKIIERAAELIKVGGIVVYPTDTLYGLGVNVYNPIAMDRLFELKERDEKKPVSLLISNINQAQDIVGQLSAREETLFNALLPGKITLLLPVKKKIEIVKFAQCNKIGFRIPENKICITLVNLSGTPISSTSVNIAHQENIQKVDDMMGIFRDKIDLILDAGPVESLRGSSVIDITTSPPTLVREGDVSCEEIEKKIGYPIYKNYPEKFTITFICSGNLCRSPMAAGILKNIIVRTKYKKLVNINSAGILKMHSMPAEPNAIEVAFNHSVILHSHHSRTVTEEIMREANIVICMALDHYKYLVNKYPHLKEKIILLKQWKLKEKLINPSIPDPIGQSFDFYQDVFKEIQNEIKRILPYIIIEIKKFISR